MVISYDSGIDNCGVVILEFLYTKIKF